MFVFVFVFLAIATASAGVLSARDTLDEIWWYRNNGASIVSVAGNAICTVAMTACAIASVILVVTW